MGPDGAGEDCAGADGSGLSFAGNALGCLEDGARGSIGRPAWKTPMQLEGVIGSPHADAKRVHAGLFGLRQQLGRIGAGGKGVDAEGWAFGELPRLRADFSLDVAGCPRLGMENFELQLWNGAQLGTHDQQVSPATEARQQP